MDPRRVGQYFLYAFISMLFAHVAVADDWDPLDDAVTNATLLVLDETYQAHGPHSLDATDIEDWFQVSLAAGIPCQFESSSTLDTKAFLYSDAAGTVEVANDDQNGTGDNFMLRYFPETSGTYYLKVREFVTGTGGSYTLHYGFYAADEWDPMDNIATNGTLLTMGEAAKIHESHVLDTFDHYDWFRVNLSSGTVYRFESIGSSDTYGYIYSDPAAAAEMENDDGSVDYNFQINYTAMVDRVFHLKVKEYTGEGDAGYDLRYYIPANDSDGDQLLDSWETNYFTDLTHEPLGLEGDSDPYNNLEEYIAGTDPTNPASFFAVTNGLAGSSLVVEWPSVANRTYQVLWAESLTNSFQQIGPMIDHPQNSYTDTTHDAESSGFYRVEVQLK